jgi:hypothetical protein
MKPKRILLATRGKSRVSTTSSRPAEQPDPALDREVAKKLLELWKLPRETGMFLAFANWVYKT